MMDSNLARNQQAIDVGTGSIHSDDTQVGLRSDHTNHEQHGAYREEDGYPLNNEKESHLARNETIVTPASEGDHRATKLESMDKVDTTRSDSDDHTLNVRDTVKGAKKSIKNKVYLHHRNRKGLDKQFTAGNMPDPRTSHDYQNRTDPEAQLEPVNTHAPNVWQNFVIMLTTFPYWNMAFWSGWCYTIGSAMFVVDGAWSWVPLQWPGTEFKGQEKYGVPLLFFFGACLYQVGGVMAYLEAVNDGSFAGAAMKRLLEGHQDIEKELLDAKLHTFFGHLVPHHHHHDDSDEDHHHSQSQSSDPDTNWKQIVEHESPENIYAETKDRVERRGGVDEGPTEQGKIREYLRWRWWPTWHGLKTYHIYELGYLACAIQLFGVTLYGVTSVVILPGILSSLEWWQELGAYWVPQVVASCCFLIASVMFTIMAQDKWNKPKWGAVSWWIGIHAQIGSVGFLLCAIFGLVGHTHHYGEYQSSLSSMWGSFFYMLSGLFQWYEAINVNVGPVLAFPNNRTPVLLRNTGR